MKRRGGRTRGMITEIFWEAPGAGSLETLAACQTWAPRHWRGRSKVEEIPMAKVQADRLMRIGAALLKAAGASEEEAHAVAVGCVNANLAGHDSHGGIAIPTYIDRIKAGHIVPGAK